MYKVWRSQLHIYVLLVLKERKYITHKYFRSLKGLQLSRERHLTLQFGQGMVEAGFKAC